MTLITPTNPTPTRSTMRRDLLAAYVASGMKVVSWAGVSAFILRYSYYENLAMMALVRSTLGLLNYTTLGLAPAMIRLIAQASAVEPTVVAETLPEKTAGSLDYLPRLTVARRFHPADQVFANALAIGSLVLIVGLVLVKGYAIAFPVLHIVEEYPPLPAVQEFVFAFGVGTLLRLFSDVPGAVIQTHDLIGLDSLFLAGAEAVWLIGCFNVLSDGGHLSPDYALVAVGEMYVMSAVLLLIVRFAVALAIRGGWFSLSVKSLSRPIMASLLSFGGLLVVAQLADFLYAPTDFVLINRLLTPIATATYVPAVQIDAGLLLLVAAIGNVLLPKAALAHASGNVLQLRAYFVRGTLVSMGLLLCASIAVYIASPIIFKLWLHDPMPATQAILPLILIHTVVGGSSAVGRSILLGMGKVKPFTIAVLIAGVSNVILSYSFVRFGGMGLNGIVLGTIFAVVGRCAVWQPWYVWKCLRDGN